MSGEINAYSIEVPANTGDAVLTTITRDLDFNGRILEATYHPAGPIVADSTNTLELRVVVFPENYSTPGANFLELGHGPEHAVLIEADRGTDPIDLSADSSWNLQVAPGDRLALNVDATGTAVNPGGVIAVRAIVDIPS